MYPFSLALFLCFVFIERLASLSRCLKVSEPSAQQEPEQKRKAAFGLSYLIDENPPWYISILLGFQVSRDNIRLKDIRAKNFYNTDFFHTLATVR